MRRVLELFQERYHAGYRTDLLRVIYQENPTNEEWAELVRDSEDEVRKRRMRA